MASVGIHNADAKKMFLPHTRRRNMITNKILPEKITRSPVPANNPASARQFQKKIKIQQASADACLSGNFNVLLDSLTHRPPICRRRAPYGPMERKKVHLSFASAHTSDVIAISLH